MWTSHTVLDIVQELWSSIPAHQISFLPNPTQAQHSQPQEAISYWTPAECWCLHSRILDCVPKAHLPTFLCVLLVCMCVLCVPASSGTWSFLMARTIFLQTRQKNPPHLQTRGWAPRLLLLISLKQGGQKMFTSWGQVIDL